MSFKDDLRSIKETLRDLSLGTAFLILIGVMFFVPPVMFVVETVDLIRMHDRAQGEVDAVRSVSGSKGTSRTIISYHFQVAGRKVISDRYVPGFFGNFINWTGGSAVAKHFRVGQPVTVYYSGQNPELCALEYGWFCWSVALTFGIIVFVLRVYASRLQPGTLATCIWCTGVAFGLYGTGQLFFGPPIVRVADVHWHMVAWCSAFAGAALYAVCTKRFPTTVRRFRILRTATPSRRSSSADTKRSV